MKPFQVRIAREALLSLINPLMAVVGRSTTVANGIALGNIKLHAEQGRLFATASNGITTVENRVDAEVKTEGTCYLPARKLFEIVRAMNEGAQVDIQTQKDWAAIKVPHSSYKLHNSDADMFPLPSGDVTQEGVKASLEVSQKDLQQALTESSYCMGVNDVRVMLNGLLFDVLPDEMRLIGTDGHRMALSKLRFNSGAKIKAIVPNETIHFLIGKLAKSEDPVRVEFSDRYCRITIDKLVYQTQLVSGRPVEYEAVIPVGGKKVCTQRRELIGVIERAKIVANTKTLGVHIHVESGQIGVSASNPEQENSRENLDASTELDDLAIGFNANYLIQALQSIEADEVTVSMRDSAASVLIYGGAPERHINVVMPLRI